MAATLGRVTDLFVYPIKSLGGCRLESAAVGELGLASDRRWMLVDDAGVFLTQRANPRMALAHVAPNAEGVTVTAPGQDALTLTPPPRDAARRRVQIWDDVVEGTTYPAEIDTWFSAFIGSSVHLVYMDDDVRRRVDPVNAKPDDRAPFSDAYPLLIVSRESLAALNERLAAKGVDPVVVQRFRPNIVVDGVGEAFAEDAWTDIAVGSTRLRVAKPCARCVLTTVDPATATPSPRGEPLRTLAEFRTRGGKVMFAQNTLVRATGLIAVGDAVVDA